MNIKCKDYYYKIYIFINCHKIKVVFMNYSCLLAGQFLVLVMIRTGSCPVSHMLRPFLTMSDSHVMSCLFGVRYEIVNL